MKNIFRIFILLVTFSCSSPAPAPDSVRFKISYQPETTYRQTTERTAQTVISYAGSAISLKRLKDRGIQNPTISNRKAQKEYRIKTGKAGNDKIFRFNVELIKAIGGDGKRDLSEGAVFHGRCTIDSIPEFDSVALDGLDHDSKKSLIKALENSFAQLSFPEKKLKIGQVLSVDFPLTIPMEGSTVEMVVSTQYKLIRFSKETANFDIAQTYTMNPKLLDNSFKGTGNGKGQLVFDIKNRIALRYALDTEIEIRKKLDSFEFDLKTKASFVQETSIITN